MKKIALLVLRDSVAASIIDPRTIFVGVNDYLQSVGEGPAFELHLVGLEQDVTLHGGVLTIHATHLLSQATQPDLIIIPALAGDLMSAAKKNRDFIPWIKEQRARGAEVASLCVGAYFLATTGLLDGKQCSSHWCIANQFREHFPAVTMVDGKIVTEQEGIYSSGGATSYWNLLLHLVEKYAGRELALWAAKMYALDIHRKSQSPFIIFAGQKNHQDESIKKAQIYIENNIKEKITVDDLADQVAIGRRHFERRFKVATNNTPSEYIHRVKVEAAKKQFETTLKNVNEVMFEIGYNDPKAFRSTFKKVTGLSPQEYRLKFSRHPRGLSHR